MWGGSKRVQRISNSEEYHKNSHLKHITEGLLGYSPPINALSSQKRVMSRAMHKPQSLSFKRFTARLAELNDYLPLLPGSIKSNKVVPEELNEILLQSIPNGWAKQSYLQGWNFEGRTYKETCKIFE